jgi:parvulin-like peptidyl-prolyl isomerase
MNIRPSLWFVLVLFLASSCVSRLPEPVRAGRMVLVTKKQLLTEIESQTSGGRTLPLGFRQMILTNMARKALFLRDARANGYAEKDEVVRFLTDRKRQFVIQAALARAIGQVRPAFRQGDLRKFNSVIEIRLIWINVPWTLDAGQRAAGTARARACYKEVRKPGADFAALADRYSDDPANLRGGFLGQFPEEDLPPVYKPLVGKMKSGDISAPVEETNGWMILRLDSIAPGSGRSSKSFGLSGIFFSSVRGGKDEARKNADRVLAELRQDPSRFKELADRYSEDPQNRNGGLLKPFIYERMYPPVAEAAWKAGPGKISGLIETRYGWFIVQTVAVRPPSREAIKRIRKDRAQYRSVVSRILQRKISGIREERVEAYRRALSRKTRMLRDYSCFSNSSLTNRELAASTVILKVLRDNTSFSYLDFAQAFDKAAGPGASVRKTYGEKAAFFESTLLFPELVYADGSARGALTSRTARKKWSEIEDSSIYQYYLKDLGAGEEPTDADLKDWVKTGPDVYRMRPFEQVREQVRAAWKVRQRELVARQKFQTLVAMMKVQMSDAALLTPSERRSRLWRNLAADALRSGRTNEAITSLEQCLAKSPEWSDAVHLAAISPAGFDRAVRRIRPKLGRISGDPAPLLDDPATRAAMLGLSTALSFRPVIPAVQARLTDPDYEARKAYVRTLADLNAISSSSAILQMVMAERGKTESAAFCSAVLPDLGRLADDAVRSALSSWLSSERMPPVQAALLRSLAGAKDDETLELVERFAASPWPEVREASLAAADAIRRGRP